MIAIGCGVSQNALDDRGYGSGEHEESLARMLGYRSIMYLTAAPRILMFLYWFHSPLPWRGYAWGNPVER